MCMDETCAGTGLLGLHSHWDTACGWMGAKQPYYTLIHRGLLLLKPSQRKILDGHREACAFPRE